jgi:hypothetical protein
VLLSDRPVMVTVRELADGTVTARGLVEACLADARGALELHDPEATLAQAHKADRRRAEGSDRPLLGLPIAVDRSAAGHTGPRAAGAIVLGTTREPAAALAAGVCAVLGKLNATTAGWRPAGSAAAVLSRDPADLPTLGPLLGVSAPVSGVDRLPHVRIGARSGGDAVTEAATRLSLTGLRIVDVDRRLTGPLARLRGTDPLAGADVLITGSRWPVPSTHACVRTAGVTLTGRRDSEDVVLALAALLA